MHLGDEGGLVRAVPLCPHYRAATFKDTQPAVLRLTAFYSSHKMNLLAPLRKLRAFTKTSQQDPNKEKPKQKENTSHQTRALLWALPSTRPIQEAAIDFPWERELGKERACRGVRPDGD